MKNDKVIDVKLTSLIGVNVKGITAQITNPIYFYKPGMNYEGAPIRWRELTEINTYEENGKKWVEMRWKRHAEDSCNFSGCTIQSNCVTIQLKKSDYSRINKAN